VSLSVAAATSDVEEEVGGNDTVGGLALLAFAGWVFYRGGRRIVAFLIDLLGVIVLWYLLRPVLPGSEPGALAVLWPYRTAAHALGGQTVGKKMLDIRTVAADQTDAGWWRAVRRESWLGLFVVGQYALGPIPVGGTLGVVLALGLFAWSGWVICDAAVMAASEGRRSLHDYAGDTAVETL
jgi:uncharacterized RDD family membrane protein YckC